MSWKTEKIFSAHSDQGSMKRRENLFLGNILKILDLEILGLSHSSSHCRGDQACLPTDSAL